MVVKRKSSRECEEGGEGVGGGEELGTWGMIWRLYSDEFSLLLV